MLDERLKLLIVEENEILRDLYSIILVERYVIIGAHGSVESAIKQLEHDKPDRIITEYVFRKGDDGLAVARYANERYGLKSIIVSILDQTTINSIKGKEYCSSFIKKPFDIKEIICAIETPNQ